MSLNTAYDSDNIFAKIIRGDMACTKVYEDKDILAFMDIFPQSPGHTLVIPKAIKAINIFDVDPDELSTLIIGVQKIAKGVRKGLNPDGLRIIQFNGAPAGQTVFHIHFHIIPIYSEKALASHGGGASDPAKLRLLASKIASSI